MIVDPVSLIIGVYVGFFIFLAALNKWAKKRGPHVVLDFDPSQPAIHWEDKEV